MMKTIDMPESHRRRPAPRPVAALKTISSIALISLFMYQFAMNMAAGIGLPYWDDWEYFFSPVKGIHLPLDFGALLAREADYVAPVVRTAGHAVWLGFGADMQVIRLFTWAVFACFLLAYYAFLKKASSDNHVVDLLIVLTGFLLLSVASREYFYFQHVAYSQPLCYLLFFLFCFFWLRGAYLPAVACFIGVGSFSVFGTSYIGGCVAAALLQALARRRADARIVALIVLGCGLAAAAAYMTLTGASINHTDAGLTPPWTAGFWVFTAGVFAAAVGLDPGTPTNVAIGAGVLAFYGAATAGLSALGGDDERGRGDWLVAATLWGGLLVTLVTALGRAQLCGDSFSGWTACAATPRYVFPALLAAPALVVAVGRIIAELRRREAGAPAAAVGVLALILAGTTVAGYAAGPQEDGRRNGPSTAHWDYAALRRAMVERDREGLRCVAQYVAAAPQDPAGWTQPLVCPGVIGTDDAAPYLRTAFATDAPVAETIRRAAAAEYAEAQIIGALAAATRDADGRLQTPTTTGDGAATLRPAGDGEIIGHLDRSMHLKYGAAAVVGWAADAVRRQAAPYLLLLADGKPVALGRTGGLRPDVAAALNMPEVNNGGFIIPVPDAVARSGATLQVAAVDRSLKWRLLPGTTAAVPPAPAAQ